MIKNKSTKLMLFVQIMLWSMLLLNIISKADVTFYGDTNLYLDNGNITVTFVDTGVSMYYCEYDTGNTYILLENINLTFTTANSLTINVSEVNSETPTLGQSVVRFNASGSGNVLFNFTGNFSKNVDYILYIDSVLINTYSSPSFDFTINSWSDKDVDVKFNGMYPDPPYNGVSSYNTSTNVLNLSWIRGNFSDREVIIKKTTGYSTSYTDGTEVYNYTDLFYNATITSSGYYTCWSYNETYNSFSLTGLNIPWGAINITQVVNESNFLQNITPFGLFISNQDGTVTYLNSSCTAPHVLDMLLIPYGIRTVFQINATGYETRTYFRDIVINHYYELNFTLPPFETPVDPGGGDVGGNETTTKLYRVQVVDEYLYPLDTVLVQIKRYNDVTGVYVEVASDYTDGYGEADFQLISNIKYLVELTLTEYQQLGSKFWTPDPDYYGINYPKIFKMKTIVNESDVYSFWQIIILEGTMYDNGSLFVEYTDLLTNTTDAYFNVYENYNYSSVLKGTTSTTNNDYSFWVTGLNISREHQIVIYLNHTNLGYEIQSIIILRIYNESIDIDDVEEIITDVTGELDGINLSHVFFVYLPSIILLVIFTKGNPGLGCISCGLWLGFVGALFTIPSQLFVICPFIVVLGVILIMVKGGKIRI